MGQRVTMSKQEKDGAQLRPTQEQLALSYRGVRIWGTTGERFDVGQYVSHHHQTYRYALMRNCSCAHILLVSRSRLGSEMNPNTIMFVTRCISQPKTQLVTRKFLALMSCE